MVSDWQAVRIIRSMQDYNQTCRAEGGRDPPRRAVRRFGSEATQCSVAVSCVRARWGLQGGTLAGLPPSGAVGVRLAAAALRVELWAAATDAFLSAPAPALPTASVRWQQRLGLP